MAQLWFEVRVDADNGLFPISIASRVASNQNNNRERRNVKGYRIAANCYSVNMGLQRMNVVRILSVSSISMMLRRRHPAYSTGDS